jgi:hypothetical protein
MRKTVEDEELICFRLMKIRRPQKIAGDQFFKSSLSGIRPPRLTILLDIGEKYGSCLTSKLSGRCRREFQYTAAIGSGPLERIVRRRWRMRRKALRR